MGTLRTANANDAARQHCRGPRHCDRAVSGVGSRRCNVGQAVRDQTPMEQAEVNDVTLACCGIAGRGGGGLSPRRVHRRCVPAAAEPNRAWPIGTGSSLPPPRLRRQQPHPRSHQHRSTRRRLPGAVDPPRRAAGARGRRFLRRRDRPHSRSTPRPSSTRWPCSSRR